MNVKLASHISHPHRRVTPYVRHSANCPHEDKGRHYRGHGGKGCGCNLWLEFMCDGKQVKVAADTRSWQEADDLAARVTNGSGMPQAATVSTSASDVTVDAAVEEFVEYKTSGDGQVADPSKIAVILRRMVEYLKACGVVRLADVHTTHLSNFRSTWQCKRIKLNSSENRGKTVLSEVWRTNTIMIRAFFKWALDHDPIWITVDPAAKSGFDLKQEVGSEEKIPFTPEEMRRILKAIDELPMVTRGYHANEPKYHQRRQQLLRAFVLTMRFSGLAIQDALALERDQLQADDRLQVRRTKTGVGVFAKLPPHVATVLRELPRTNGHFFWNIEERSMSSLSHFFSMELRRVFKVAGIKKLTNSTSHRFRHTYATELLSAGVPPSEVARLMGHDEKTLHRYYDHFVKPRQQRLDDLITASWAQQDMLQA